DQAKQQDRNEGREHGVGCHGCFSLVPIRERITLNSGQLEASNSTGRSADYTVRFSCEQGGPTQAAPLEPPSLARVNRARSPPSPTPERPCRRIVMRARLLQSDAKSFSVPD